MADQSADLMPSAMQKPYAAIVAVVAIVAVGAVTAIAMLHYKKASDAVTVLGPVVAVISSLVAAYFGVRSGSLSQQKANEGDAIRQQLGGPG
jgi:type IV secretory pathway VirB2 component (pilin)